VLKSKQRQHDHEERSHAAHVGTRPSARTTNPQSGLRRSPHRELDTRSCARPPGYGRSVEAPDSKGGRSPASEGVLSPDTAGRSVVPAR
jgi:hypothetical protein